MFIIETYIVSTHLRWKPGQLPNISNESHLKSPSLPRSTMELAVQLFCIPVEGTKSESKERFASKLESNIREDRTFLMRLETWSCNDECDDIMGGPMVSPSSPGCRSPLCAGPPSVSCRSWCASSTHHRCPKNICNVNKKKSNYLTHTDGIEPIDLRKH